MIELVASIEARERGDGVPQVRLAEWRAEIDALVLDCYGVSPDGARLLFEDFRLLDRGQEPLPGESRSTVTRDLVLQALAALRGVEDQEVEARLAMARTVGAEGYVPAQAAGAKGRPQSRPSASVAAAWQKSGT